MLNATCYIELNSTKVRVNPRVVTKFSEQQLQRGLAVSNREHHPDIPYQIIIQNQPLNHTQDTFYRTPMWPMAI